MASSDDAGNDVDDIRAIARRWTEAAEAGDLAGLDELMCEDIVVTHGDGRTLTGKREVLEDFARAFRAFRVEQHVQSEETVVDQAFALDRARVRSVVVDRNGGGKSEVRSRTWTLLRRVSRRSWCVARVIGVVERPVHGEHDGR